MTRANLRRVGGVWLALWILAPAQPQAATQGIYHPYVIQGERELEYGVVWRDLDATVALQRLSFGYAWHPRMASEIYLIAEGIDHFGQRTRGFELETKIQLTEQGEGWADWGLLFEYEHARNIGQRELAVGLLWEKELPRRWVATANAIVEYEFGSEVENELETAIRGQLRYLHRPGLEPAFELYLDDQDYAAGPALLGAWRLGAGRQVRWEWSWLLGLNDKTPDQSLRAAIEFEF